MELPKIFKNWVDVAPCGLFYLRWVPAGDFEFVLVNEFGKQLANLPNPEGSLLCDLIPAHRDPLPTENGLSLYEIYYAISYKQIPYPSGRRKTRLEFDSPHFGGKCWFDQIVQHVAPGELAIGCTNCTDDVLRQKELEKLVKYDTLTQVYSRYTILNALEQRCACRRRDKDCFSILMLDVDHFKLINDHHGGHAVGDQVLIELCDRISKCLRSDDVLGRLSGDEFLVILPGAGLEEAQRIGQRILEFVRRPYRPSFTVSIGAASIQGISLENITTDVVKDLILSRADQALYKAKENGRDTVFVANPAWN